MARKPTALDEFVSSMNFVETVSKASERAQDDRTKVHDAGLKDLYSIGYKFATDNGIVDPKVMSKDDLAKTPQGRDDLKNYASAGQSLALQKGSNILQDNIDAVVKEIKPSSLEKAVGIKELQDAAGDKYITWLKNYGAVNATKDLVSRAKAGKLTEEETEALRVSIAEKRAAEAKGRFAAYDADRQELVATMIKAAVMRGYRDKNSALEAAQGELVKAEVALKVHEQTSGQNLVGYVTAALSKLTKGSTEDFNKARGITYALATGK